MKCSQLRCLAESAWLVSWPGIKHIPFCDVHAENAINGDEGVQYPIIKIVLGEWRAPKDD